MGLVSTDPGADAAAPAGASTDDRIAVAAELAPPRFRPGVGLFWTLLLAVLFFGGVALAVTHLSEPQRFLALLESARLEVLLFAIPLQALTYVVAGAAWRVALVRGGAPLRLTLLARIALAKLAFDQLIPTGGVSGTAFLVHTLRRQALPGALAFAVLFVSWAGYTIGYVIAVAGAVVVLAFRDAFHPAIITLLAIFVVIMIGRVIGLIIARRLPHQRWPHSITRFRKVDVLLREAAAAPRGVSTSPTVIVKSGTWHVAVYLLDAGTLYVCLLAVGATAHPADVLASFMIAMLVATVGFLPGGLGTFEAACVAMLNSFDVPLEDALAGTVLLRGFTYWLPMIPGALLARQQLRSPRPTPSPADHPARAAAVSAAAIDA
jgi:glycosyltransferase 2 family protein